LADAADTSAVARKLDLAGDGGVTMVEVLVALAVITVLMAGLGNFLVTSQQVSRSQSHLQAATRLAQQGLEQARGYGGLTLLIGRAACGTCVTTSGYDDGYLTNTVRWDAAVPTVTPAVPIPDTPETRTVNNVDYSRYWFVGRCWQPAAGGPCTTTVAPAAMVRLVVSVVWKESGCPASRCSWAATALFAADPLDPVFPQ
jgi:prepilin-type N-terminal cleavage/methylation domain-containing protein